MSVTTEDRDPRRESRAQRRRDEHALFARLAADPQDNRARDALVERFLPLARSLALRYQRSGEPLDDLVQVASLGLIKAVDRYDADRGIAFSSYAVPTILGEIKRHFRDRTWSVRVPRGLQELSQRVDRAVAELAEQLSRQPSVSEIATAVGAEQEDVLEAMQAGGAYRAVSFEAPRGGGDGEQDRATLGDAIGVREDGFDRAEERAVLDQLMGTISARERDVLRMRFQEDMTQAEIGAAVGVSQMQISRIIRQALARMLASAESPAGDAPLD